MHSDHCVTGWIEDLHGHSDAEAAQAIWEKFQRRLMAVAFRNLGGAVRGAGDADDVVNEAFASFHRRIGQGQYETIQDRDGLWRLLLRITENKARRLLRRELAVKRGAGRNRGDSVFFGTGESSAGGFDRLATAEPAPEDIAVLKETMGQLLSVLSDQEQQIAMMRMQSWPNTEIADQLSLSLATVERRLNSIRKKWSDLESEATADA